MLNRSQITAGFVKKVEQKKMGGTSNVWKHKKCNGGYKLFVNQHKTLFARENDKSRIITNLLLYTNLIEFRICDLR